MTYNWHLTKQVFYETAKITIILGAFVIGIMGLIFVGYAAWKLDVKSALRGASFIVTSMIMLFIITLKDTSKGENTK